MLRLLLSPPNPSPINPTRQPPLPTSRPGAARQEERSRGELSHTWLLQRDEGEGEIFDLSCIFLSSSIFRFAVTVLGSKLFLVPFSFLALCGVYGAAMFSDLVSGFLKVSLLLRILIIEVVRFSDVSDPALGLFERFSS